MKISKGVLDFWVLIPTIALDFRFKEIGFVWLKWTCNVTFLK